MSIELTINEAAEREGVTRQTIHTWLNIGLPSRFVALKGLAKRRLIDSDQLTLWIAQQRRDGTGA